MAKVPGWVKSVNEFWFEEMGPERWFEADQAVDSDIDDRFSTLHASLAKMEVDEIATDPATVLAAIIVLDQFSRNMYRKTAKAFAFDGKAIQLARRAVRNQFDQGLTEDQRKFLYMPFMHSENLDDQNRSVELFEKLGDENSLKFAIEHRDIIERFGRFPYRNEVLGRESTEAEVSFTEADSGFGQ